MPRGQSFSFFADHRRALLLASKLLPCPISDTPILYLYDQIRLCILFNLNGPAITFCGMLVEYTLKYTTYAKENPGVPDFDSSAWEAFEEITLVPAIVRARKARLIDEKLEKSLRSFAKDLRNKYSHFNIQKITKDAVFEQVRQRDIENKVTASEAELDCLSTCANGEYLRRFHNPLRGRISEYCINRAAC